MFAMSRGDLKSAYTCGTYHRRGRAGCTSHHIRTDKLDELLKSYVRQVMDHSRDMLERLNEELAREREDVQETEQSASTGWRRVLTRSPGGAEGHKAPAHPGSDETPGAGGAAVRDL